MRDMEDKQTLDIMTGGLRIGYARVSKTEQNLDMQLDALEKAGCQTIYHDKISGAAKELPEQEQAIKALRPGDTLVVWKIDRLGRKAVDLLRLVESLQEKGVDFISLTDSIDTSTPTGKMFFTISAAYAELERSRLIERTIEGLAAARARGRKGGRKRVFGKKEKVEIESLLANPDITVSDIAKRYNVSRNTIYRNFNVRAIHEKQVEEQIKALNNG